MDKQSSLRRLLVCGARGRLPGLAQSPSLRGHRPCPGYCSQPTLGTFPTPPRVLLASHHEHLPHLTVGTILISPWAPSSSPCRHRLPQVPSLSCHGCHPYPISDIVPIPPHTALPTQQPVPTVGPFAPRALVPLPRPRCHVPSPGLMRGDGAWWRRDVPVSSRRLSRCRRCRGSSPRCWWCVARRRTGPSGWCAPGTCGSL